MDDNNNDIVINSALLVTAGRQSFISQTSHRHCLALWAGGGRLRLGLGAGTHEHKQDNVEDDYLLP